MTTQIEFAAAEQKSKSPLGRLIWVAPLAMLSAAAANLGLYAAAGRLAPEVTAWPGAGTGQIVGSTLVYLLIGTAVFAIITRISSHPARHYLIAASVGLLLSLTLPISAGIGYGAPGAPPAGATTVLALSLMHIVSFALSTTLFIRLALD